MAYRVSRQVFETLVEQAVARIHKKYRRLFRNLSIRVEDSPAKEDLGMLDIPGNAILGIFRGAPLSSQGGFFDIQPHMPDQIALFQRNLESFCSSEEELIEEIRKTLLHEVGHYFGLSEEELETFE
jgi:predicted Zn-dependent protease with MMP-like domain